MIMVSKGLVQTLYTGYIYIFTDGTNFNNMCLCSWGSISTSELGDCAIYSETVVAVVEETFQIYRASWRQIPRAPSTSVLKVDWRGCLEIRTPSEEKT